MDGPIPKFSVVIPLWNEAENIDELVAMLGSSRIISGGHGEAVLVDNGSKDATGRLLRRHAASNTWITPIYLEENLNYGGGLLEGASRARGQIVCFMPGDLQYLAPDLDRVVERAVTLQEAGNRVLVKGNRIRRLDSGSMRFVSSVYTQIANLLLGLSVADVNGLPKAFDRALLAHLPSERMKTFVLDAQLIHIARKAGWGVEEVDVTFHARRAGVSSWSGRRVQTYLRSIRQLWRVRAAGIARPQ
jgi:glycosyltransferase involved in cell wall biosynthesis